MVEAVADLWPDFFANLSMKGGRFRGSCNQLGNPKLNEMKGRKGW